MSRVVSAIQTAVADEEGLLPILNWIKRLCDHVIQTLLGADNLEFSWRHEPTIDPTIQRENLVAYVSAGMMTRRRAAEIMGEALPDDPMADVLTVTTGQGVVKLGGDSVPHDVGKQGSASFVPADDAQRLGKFAPDQPRDDHGRWTATFAGDVINICVASGVARSTDQFGNKAYSVSYECRDGYVIKLDGLGGEFRGFIRDPRD